MTHLLPTFRVHNDYGDVVLRDGLVLSFFMRRSHGEVAPGLWRALQTYRQAIPPQALAWYVTPDGDWEPMDDKGWAYVREEILKKTWPSGSLARVHESCSETRAYNFEYFGRWLDSPLHAGNEGIVCAAAFTLPTEYLMEQGPDRVRDLALELARELPFNFGYASPAWLSDFHSPAERALYQLCSRFPGMAVYRLSPISMEIGARALGTYWLTFLGQPLLGQLGGPDALRLRLPADISFTPMDGERLLLRLGEWPLAGNAEDDMSLYRALARVLEPSLYQGEIPWLIDEDFERRWLRRFLD